METVVFTIFDQAGDKRVPPMIGGSIEWKRYVKRVSHDLVEPVPPMIGGSIEWKPKKIFRSEPLHDCASDDWKIN